MDSDDEATERKIRYDGPPYGDREQVTNGRRYSSVDRGRGNRFFQTPERNQEFEQRQQTSEVRCGRPSRNGSVATASTDGYHMIHSPLMYNGGNRGTGTIQGLNTDGHRPIAPETGFYRGHTNRGPPHNNQAIKMSEESLKETHRNTSTNIGDHPPRNRASRDETFGCPPNADEMSRRSLQAIRRRVESVGRSPNEDEVNYRSPQVIRHGQEALTRPTNEDLVPQTLRTVQESITQPELNYQTEDYQTPFSPAPVVNFGGNAYVPVNLLDANKNWMDIFNQNKRELESTPRNREMERTPRSTDPDASTRDLFASLRRGRKAQPSPGFPRAQIPKVKPPPKRMVHFSPFTKVVVKKGEVIDDFGNIRLFRQAADPIDIEKETSLIMLEKKLNAMYKNQHFFFETVDGENIWIKAQREIFQKLVILRPSSNFEIITVEDVKSSGQFKCPQASGRSGTHLLIKAAKVPTEELEFKNDEDEASFLDRNPSGVKFEKSKERGKRYNDFQDYKKFQAEEEESYDYFKEESYDYKESKSRRYQHDSDEDSEYSPEPKMAKVKNQLKKEEENYDPYKESTSNEDELPEPERKYWFLQDYDSADKDNLNKSMEIKEETPKELDKEPREKSVGLEDDNDEKYRPKINGIQASDGHMCCLAPHLVDSVLSQLQLMGGEQVVIDRQDPLGSASTAYLKLKEAKGLGGNISYSISGEKGIDFGGVTREVQMLLISAAKKSTLLSGDEMLGYTFVPNFNMEPYFEMMGFYLYKSSTLSSIMPLFSNLTISLITETNMPSTDLQWYDAFTQYPSQNCSELSYNLKSLKEYGLASLKEQDASVFFSLKNAAELVMKTEEFCPGNEKVIIGKLFKYELTGRQLWMWAGIRRGLTKTGFMDLVQEHPCALAIHSVDMMGFAVLTPDEFYARFQFEDASPEETDAIEKAKSHLYHCLHELEDGAPLDIAEGTATLRDLCVYITGFTNILTIPVIEVSYTRDKGSHFKASTCSKSLVIPLGLSESEFRQGLIKQIAFGNDFSMS